MSPYHQILAALSGSPTQTDRLLVLHTPLGPDAMVAERAWIDEGLLPGAPGLDGLAAGAIRSGGARGAGKASGPGDPVDPTAGFRLVVDALCPDTHVELKTLIGQPVLLELLTADSRTALRPFHGHVTDITLLGSDGGLARYRLVVEPWLALLAHRQDSWVFQSRTVVQIVEEVFADYAAQGRLLPAWRWDLADPSVYAERSLCVQYQECDLAFVQRLLLEEGLFAWFEHTGDASADDLGSHTLVIADHNGAFADAEQPVVRYTQASAVLPEDSLTRWRRRHAVQTATLELASRDYVSRSLRPQSQQAAVGAVAASGGASAAGAVPDRSAGTGDGTATLPELALIDVPGIYAYEDAAQGARLALRQMQALDALREQFTARGSVRSSAPGTMFTLTDHPVHDGLDAARDRFVTLSVRHTARNNLRSDHPMLAGDLAASIAAVNARGPAGHVAHHTAGQAPQAALANQSKEPLYACHLVAQRAAVPVRMAAMTGVASSASASASASGSGSGSGSAFATFADSAGADGLAASASTSNERLPDVRLHRRPTVFGVQTAIVVGAAEPVHTDRDHRIKVQFHWQRGAQSSHRLSHPAGDDNAPASAASGTWVRVAESVAGPNWGSVFTPRLGQEVLVQFIGGDIDRPVVVGSLYNGRGNVDAQGNAVGSGAATATGNASAWFPGQARQGQLEAHAHGAVLAGYKSQELPSSQSGGGGSNQLVFDDSPGAGRIELSSTQSQTRLQIGHLLQQTDNRRLQPRGHGLDLGTAAWGALRAGSGMLVSAHKKSGSTGADRALDSREPAAQIGQAQELLHTLAESAQQHNAKLSGSAEPDTVGATKTDSARLLNAERGLHASADSLAAVDSRGQGGSSAGAGAGAGAGHEGADGAGSSGANTAGNDGGRGTVTAWSRPDLVLAAPGGVSTFTPAASITSAGNTVTLVAGQDLQQIAQRHFAVAAKDGVVLYTYGRAQNASKPNQETGIALHAASGNVNTQSQSGATKITADKQIAVSSTSGMVRIAAPQHVLLTAAGAAIDIQPGSITLKGPGMVEFRASAKELTGPGSANQSLELKKPGQLFDEAFVMQDELSGQPVAMEPYHIVNAAGAVVAQGVTTPSGHTQRVFSAKADGLVLHRGWPKTAGDRATADIDSADERYDEQLIFVNANGALLGNIRYDVLLDDGTKVSGTTDAQGRTNRITTDSAQAVKRVTLQARPLNTCCSLHAERHSETADRISFAPPGVSTNSTDVGASTKQIQTPRGEARGLTASETAMARQLFGSSIDYGKVKVHNGEYLWLGLQPDDTAMTPNGEMYFNPKWFQEDYSTQQQNAIKHWFMHEMVHVWQYQLGYPVMLRGAVRIGLSYQYKLEMGKRLNSYNMEAQGNLLADYFALKHLADEDAMAQKEYAGSLQLFETETLLDFLASPAGKNNLPSGD